MIITAQQASRVAWNKPHRTQVDQIDRIYKMIEAAATCGEYMLVSNEYLTEETQNHLLANGYIVKIDKLSNNTVIFWG